MLCEQISQFFLNITTYSEYTLSKQHIFNTNLTHGTTKLYTCDVNWLHVFFLEMNRFFSKRQTTVKGSTQPTYKLQHICDQRNNDIRQNADCDAKNTPQGNKGNHKNNKQNHQRHLLFANSEHPFKNIFILFVDFFSHK